MHRQTPRLFESLLDSAALAPRQAYDLERQQLETALGTDGLVSLTDHDDIEAGSSLAVVGGLGPIPVSVEWTVPFGPTFFHLGVHNLPLPSAPGPS